MRQAPTILGKQRRLIAAPRSVARGAAFTLIELLIVIAILTVLIAIVTASLAKVRVSAKSFVCKNQLKTVAFEFIQFADDIYPLWRGHSDEDNRPGFNIQDFQERLYGVAEFSKTPPGRGNEKISYKADEHPLICPCGPQELGHYPDRRSALDAAVTPIKNISIGFNLRLYRTGPAMNEIFHLTKSIMEHTTVPLAFDVDGEKAAAPGAPPFPFFSAPRAGITGPWSYWFPPQRRHGGHINAAFVGGHVDSSSQPDKQGGWNWKYRPPLP